MTTVSDLDALFPPDRVTIVLREKEYRVGKITVDIMGSVNVLTDKAYAAIDLTRLEDEVDVAAIAAGAVAALIDGGDAQARLMVVVEKLIGIPPELFKSLEIEELVDLIVKLVKANKDFFSMRLAPKMRTAMMGLQAQMQK